MKFLYRTFLILIVFAGFVSCDDEVIGERLGGDTNLNAQFRVDINGETFYANQSGMLTTEDGFTEIVGKRNDGAMVRLKVAGSGTSTFILDGSVNGQAYFFDNPLSDPYDAALADTIGMLSITKYDIINGLGSGEFSFRAYRDNLTVPGDSTTTDTIDVDTTDTYPGWSLPDTLEFTNGMFTDISLSIEGDDIDPPFPPDSSLNSFHVELDGELYDTDNISAEYTVANGLFIDTQRDEEQFAISIYNINEETLQIGGENAGADITYIPNSAESETYYNATAGTLQISSIDLVNNVISGTFTGTLTQAGNPDNTIQMTNGVFDGIDFISEVSDEQYMMAKIGSSNFVSYDVEVDSAEANLINVRGTDSSGNQMQLTIPPSVNVGTYQVSNSGAFTAVYYKQEGADNIDEYSSVLNSGNIKITEKEGTVLIGTFTLSVRNAEGVVLQVTQGEFKTDTAL